MAQEYTLVFASAATANGSYPSTSGLEWAGGNGIFFLSGTHNGATIAIEVKYPSSSTWVTLPSGSFTDLNLTPARILGIPRGAFIRVTISSAGGSTSLNAMLTAS